MKQRKVIVKESTGRRIIEQSRVRLWCVGFFFLLCFGSIGVRMVDVAVIHKLRASTVTVTDPDNEDKTVQVDLKSTEPVLQRGDIVDRELVATSLMTASVFVNPKEIKNPEEAAAKLSRTLNIDGKLLLARLKSGKSFLWIKRYLAPKDEQRVNALGIPGLYFQPEEKRIYPYANLLAHVTGYVGIDNKGLAGIEKQFDARLRDPVRNREPFALSIDVRLQGMMREEMMKAVEQFQALGATGIVLDVQSGELLSMVSLPDFDPNKPGKAEDEARFNRASLGDGAGI
jgi:cell division protein FtsI (penicillin-binding protein 3)